MELKPTKDYLLLIDEKAEIKEGDYGFSEQFHDSSTPTIVTIMCLSHKIELELKKVIAYHTLTKEAKELDLPLLPEFKEEIDVERLALEYAPVEIYTDDDGYSQWDLNLSNRIGFRDGYKAAQSKQFSLEDIKKAIEMAREQSFVGTQLSDGLEFDYTDEEIIQSLSTQQLPSEFIPEYEKKFKYKPSGTEKRDGGFYEFNKLKTITNSKGKEELVGIYKY